MEGCSKYCSFCVVPYTRGPEISRPFDDIVAEIAALAAGGVKEVTLLGQNVNAWRGDIAGEAQDFAELLRYVAEIEGIERIRYTTSHPKEMTPRLIDAYRTVDKLVSQLHLPVQSGSDRVLAAMKRGYTALEYKSIVRKLRAARPGLSLSSDFIVGFPGETDEDFEQLASYLERSPLTHVHVFPYSDRPGTAASTMKGKVPGAIVRERGRRVREIGSRLRERFHESQVGTTHAALTLEDGSVVVTGNYLKLRIPPGRGRNEWVQVRMTSHQHGELLGC
jgi:tRNA-2-methylthio-N6-dimethylallyladenosine synthase